MKMKLVLFTISAAALAVSADCQAMYRRVPSKQVRVSRKKTVAAMPKIKVPIIIKVSYCNERPHIVEMKDRLNHMRKMIFQVETAVPAMKQGLAEESIYLGALKPAMRNDKACEAALRVVLASAIIGLADHCVIPCAKEEVANLAEQIEKMEQELVSCSSLQQKADELLAIAVKKQKIPVKYNIV